MTKEIRFGTVVFRVRGCFTFGAFNPLGALQGSTCTVWHRHKFPPVQQAINAYDIITPSPTEIYVQRRRRHPLMPHRITHRRSLRRLSDGFIFVSHQNHRGGPNIHLFFPLRVVRKFHFGIVYEQRDSFFETGIVMVWFPQRDLHFRTVFILFPCPTSKQQKHMYTTASENIPRIRNETKSPSI